MLQSWHQAPVQSTSSGSWLVHNTSCNPWQATFKLSDSISSSMWAVHARKCPTTVPLPVIVQTIAGQPAIWMSLCRDKCAPGQLA